MSLPWDISVNFSSNKIFSEANFKTTISSNLIDFDLDYFFLKTFTFKTNYSYTSVSNSILENPDSFSLFNANLSYQKEDSAWLFEIEASNLLNAKYKEQNFQTLLSTTNSRQYIMPRIVMLKVNYNL